MSDPTPSGSITPGFESLSPQPFNLEPKSVDASILIDSKLPGNFKSNLSRMIEYQLAGLAPQINVRQEVLDFPEPQNRPMPPEQQSRRPQPRPLPRPMPPRQDQKRDDEQPQEAEAAPEAEPVEEDGLSEFAGAALPWIGLMLVILLVFALGLVFMRRMAELFFDRASGTSADDQADPAPAARPVDVDALRAELDRSRSLRNRVLRRWLSDDATRVAQLVQLVGPEILDDLKADGEHRDQLAIVSEEVAEMTEPLDNDEAQKLARETRARLSAARLVHTEDLDGEWSFLEGLTAGTLRRVLGGLTPSEKLYVVGKLPAPLRAQYLEGLDSDERLSFFQSGSLETVDKRRSLELAARLRKAVEDIGHVGGEAEVRATLMRDMLGALRLDEQMESVQQMMSYRPEVADRLLAATCLEATVAVLPEDVLAETAHQLSVDTLTRFLTKTHPEVREAMVDALPASKRGAVETELSLDLRIGRRDFFAARAEVTELVEDVMQRGGFDLAAANQRALGVRADDRTTTTTPQEVPS